MFGSKSDQPYYRHLSALLDHLLGPHEPSPLDRSHNEEHPVNHAEIEALLRKIHSEGGSQ